jgi:hypothetical protein
MSSLDHARDSLDLIAAVVGALRLVKYGVLVENLVGRRTSTHGIDLTEHVMEVAKQ